MTAASNVAALALIVGIPCLLAWMAWRARGDTQWVHDYAAGLDADDHPRVPYGPEETP